MNHDEKKCEANTKINHPSYYGGEDNVFECIKVIESWKLGFHLGSALKYICRAGKKDQKAEIEDIEKAIFYLRRHISVNCNNLEWTPITQTQKI